MSIFSARKIGVSLFDRKRERLVPEDRGHTWVISIESLIGERNKIKSVKKESDRKAVFLLCVIFNV